jgi:arsenite methyltransferase
MGRTLIEEAFMNSTPDEVRAHVRETYGAIASQPAAASGCGGSSCCGPTATPTDSRRLGYSDGDLASAPAGADLGLGCGNPQAIAALREGERVLDLGSGAGFDAFLAARQVGPSGLVIGVDMTPEMVHRARANPQSAGVGRVEFRLGEIEHLPVDAASVDVVISNCVINLSPDKSAVFREAFRVLVPGGRLAISDVVATAELPPALASDPSAYSGCVAGAALVADLDRLIADAGFEDVRIAVRDESRTMIDEWQPGSDAGRFVASALIEARKPA